MRNRMRLLLMGTMVVAVGIVVVVFLSQANAQQTQPPLTSTPRVEQQKGGQSASGNNQGGKSIVPGQGQGSTRKVTPGAVGIGSNMTQEEYQKQKEQSDTGSLPPCENVQSDAAEGDPQCP